MALIHTLHATLAKVCPDLKLDASHAPVEASLAPSRLEGEGTSHVPPLSTQRASSTSPPIHFWCLMKAAEISVPSVLLEEDRNSLFQDFTGAYSETGMECEASRFLERN